MPFKKIRKITTNNADINKLQDAVSDSLDPLLKKSHLDSQIITNITLTQGQINQVAHLLGRKAIGYNIVNQFSQADVWNAQANDNNYIYLMTSANLVLDIEVF